MQILKLFFSLYLPCIGFMLVYEVLVYLVLIFFSPFFFCFRSPPRKPDDEPEYDETAVFLSWCKLFTYMLLMRCSYMLKK